MTVSSLERPSMCTFGVLLLCTGCAQPAQDSGIVLDGTSPNTASTTGASAAPSVSQSGATAPGTPNTGVTDPTPSGSPPTTVTGQARPTPPSTAPATVDTAVPQAPSTSAPEEDADSGAEDVTSEDPPAPSNTPEPTPPDIPREALDPDALALVRVFAGDYERHNAIVSFAYPEGVGSELALRTEDGSEIPVQVDAEGVARFVLPQLAAGAEAAYNLVPVEAQPVAVTAVHDSGAIHLRLGSATVVAFQVDAAPPPVMDPASVRGGYLHPLFTPGGVVVTGDYPEDHEWHHGIWGAWARARFAGHIVDFWNSYKNEGRVDLQEVHATWQGPVHAGIDAELVHEDLLGEVPLAALTERWLVRAYKTHDGLAPCFLVELESTQQTAGALPVELLEFEEGETYGGFAIRGHEEWNNQRAQFLTSEGDSNDSANDSNGRWCFIGGDVFGAMAGFAALGHPENFRAAQRLRVHPTDPYVAFSPVKEGDFTIEPGVPYVTRFRFVSTDGAPDPDLFDRLWNDYASPPQVSLVLAP